MHAKSMAGGEGGLVSRYHTPNIDPKILVVSTVVIMMYYNENKNYNFNNLN